MSTPASEQKPSVQPEKTVYGRISQVPAEPVRGGLRRRLFSEYGELYATGAVLDLEAQGRCSDWFDVTRENVLLVESGAGSLHWAGREQAFRAGDAIKVFAGQDPTLSPEGPLRVLSVQVVSPASPQRELPLVVDPSRVPARVYEYESLGQEVIDCDYDSGVGLIRFQCPIDRFPIHRHPRAGRLIRTISGRGYAYVDGERYVMDEDAFILFDRGVIHTNGPDAGSVYTIWAVQLPWIDPKIDESHVGGDDDFVRYIESVPPKELWRRREDLLHMVEKLR